MDQCCGLCGAGRPVLLNKLQQPARHREKHGLSFLVWRLLGPTNEFAAKLQIVCEESDESAHWLSILQETNRDVGLKALISDALQEAIELRNIFAKSKATTRSRYFSEKKKTSARRQDI